MYKTHAFSRKKYQLTHIYLINFALTKKQKVFYGSFIHIFPFFASNLLKYENVRSSDAEDEGRNKLVNK